MESYETEIQASKINQKVTSIIAYVTINSNKIASYRRVYGSDRGNNPKGTRKLSRMISARFRFINRKSYKSTYCCRLDRSEHKQHIPLNEGTPETQCWRQSFRWMS